MAADARESEGGESPRRKEIDVVAAWAGAQGGSKALWVHGLPGSGRTSVVEAAFRRTETAPGALKRVRCLPEMCLEEVLDAAADLLAQAGNPTLRRTLVQRTPLVAKVAVLAEGLRETPVIFWLDDFDEVAAAAMDGKRGPQHRFLLERLLAVWGSLDGGAGRVIITAREPPARPGIEALSVPPLSAAEARVVWEECHQAVARKDAEAAGGAAPGEPVLAFDSVPPAWRETPLALRQLAAASSRLEEADLAALLAAGDGDLVERLLQAAAPRLGAAAAVVLKALAVFPPEPSRQALRSVLYLAGIETEEAAALAACPPLRELEDWGLTSRPPLVAGSPAATSLPGAVRRAVYRSLGPPHRDAVRALRLAAGSYFLELAPKSGSPWDLYQAWRHYFLACAYEEAYEVQKTFLEEVLQRGYLDLARSILERTVASSEGRRRTVALGNLAMVYKSAGDHVRARELYGQVAAAFFEEGDTANAARALHQLGNAHFGGGNFAAAISSYQESLELSAQIGERVVASATKIQLGNAFFQCGESGRALQSYREALEEVRARKDKNIEAAIELQISQIHLDRGDYLEAEACLKSAEESALACADLRSLHKIQLAQGLAARRRRDYDTARRRYDAAIDTALSLGDRLEGAASLILAGELERDRLHLAAAIGCHLRAKALLQDPGSPGAVARETSDALCHKADVCLASLQAEMGDDAFRRLAGEVEAGDGARV